jgi:DNA-directed RNA polymerase specialized sigma24 family protein
VSAQAWDHWDDMVHAASPVVRSREDARDCAAEALTQYLESHPEVVRDAHALLTTISKRRAFDQVRAESYTRSLVARLAREGPSVTPDVADDIVARAEAVWVDEEARRLLTPELYEMLVLVGEGVPMREIAERLGMTESSANSRLVRARRTVRGALARTLAVLGIGAAAVRRTAGPAAASSAVLATAFAIAVSVPPQAAEQPRLQVLPEVTVVPGAEVVQASERSERSSSADAARLRTAARRTSARDNTIAAAQTAAAGVSVRHTDDGHRSSGPDEQLQRCVQNLRVTTRYLGCEKPRS